MTTDLDLKRDWDFLTSFLPDDWEQQAFAMRALWRRRKIPDAQALLRILLMHAGEGLSLRETAVRCKELGVADVTDVAILHRLKVSGQWTAYLCQSLLGRLRDSVPVDDSRRILSVDATNVREPGPTGSCWRLHYVMDLQTSSCLDCEVTTEKGAEQLSRFEFQKGDIVIADRGYSRARDVQHVQAAGGDVVIRYKPHSMKLFDSTGAPVELLDFLRALKDGEILDLPVWLEVDGQRINGRLCALRKSPEAIAREQRRVRDRRRRKQTKKGRDDTLEMARYFIVFTTATAAQATAAQVMGWYCWRWLIEIRFKRMKQIFDFGHLPKTDERSIKTWLHLKLLVILLVEALSSHAGRFSPWGYPIRQGRPAAQPLARREIS